MFYFLGRLRRAKSTVSPFYRPTYYLNEDTLLTQKKEEPTFSSPRKIQLKRSIPTIIIPKAPMPEMAESTKSDGNGGGSGSGKSGGRIGAPSIFELRRRRLSLLQPVRRGCGGQLPLRQKGRQVLPAQLTLRDHGRLKGDQLLLAGYGLALGLSLVQEDGGWGWGWGWGWCQDWGGGARRSTAGYPQELPGFSNNRQEASTDCCNYLSFSMYSQCIFSSDWVCNAGLSCLRSLWSASSSSWQTHSAPYRQTWGNREKPRGVSAPPAGPYRALADDTDTEDDDGSEATDVLGLGLGLDAEQRSMPMPIPYHRRLPDMAHNDYNDFEASYLSSDATQVDTHSRFSVTIQWEASAPYGQESENPAEPWGAPAPQGDPKWKDIALDDDTDTETVDNTDNDEEDDGSEVSVQLAKGAAQRSVSMPIPFQRRLSDKAHNETNEFEVSYLSSDATQEDTHSRFAKWKIPSRKLWKARPMHK